MKLEGVKEKKAYHIESLDKFAEGLAKEYDISHNLYEGMKCSDFEAKYIYEFRNKTSKEIEGQMKYTISKRWEEYWCDFELCNTIISLHLPSYNKYGLPSALSRHSVWKNQEEVERKRKKQDEEERIRRGREEIRSINRAVARYYETGDSHDFIWE